MITEGEALFNTFYRQRGLRIFYECPNPSNLRVISKIDHSKLRASSSLLCFDQKISVK